MSQTQQLVAALKHQLKARSITYAQVGARLKKSEATIKRQFSHQSFSIQTFEAVCDLVGMDLAELVQAAEEAEAGLHRLSEKQEAELVANPRRMLVAVCVLNHWTLSRIVATYRLTKIECVKHLLELDRLGLIHLMPQNRIKLRIARDFNWIPDGPIHKFFRAHVQMDFLNANFNQPGEYFRFQHAMLTPEANARFQQRLQRLLQEFSELHDDCAYSPSGTQYGTSVLIALRPWEPEEFDRLRQSPDKRVFPKVEEV